MSLMAESPVQSSSSSDDFAAFLDTELEVASSSSSPDDEEVDNAGESDIEESSNKRHKVDSEDTKDVAVKDSTGPSSDGEDMGKCPPHPGFIKGLCILCGQLEDDNGSAVAFGYIHKDLKLARKEIARLRGTDLTTVLREKKLILILDLDHTLLNSTRLVDISMEEQYLLRQAEILQNDSQRSLVKLDGMHMLTKFRPFVHTFLKEASTIFEMYVYTMAERSYALEIANILDPERVYFNSKVITQSDSTQRNQKGLDVVLGAESVVVILDDTEFVWDKHKENLILVERYHFFASSCRQHGSSVRSLSELKQDESDSNGALATILNVLKRTHQTFFNPAIDTDFSSRDVRQVLGSIRQEVLQGCVIVFSRLFPSQSQPENEVIWKMAEQLGAVCLREVDDSVTHVVTTDFGTKKSRWALQNQKFLVNPRWVEATNYLWRRQSEKGFPVLSSSDQS